MSDCPVCGMNCGDTCYRPNKPTAESEMIRLHDADQRAPDKKQLTNEILDEAWKRINRMETNIDDFDVETVKINDVLEIINNMRMK